MKNNIFEGAKFGDKFITRDNREAVYIRCIVEIIQEKEHYWHHLALAPNGKMLLVPDDYKKAHYKAGYDIVSRYQEPISEKEPNTISKKEKEKLIDTLNKYYKRHHSALHPSFLTGAKYIIKHLKEE